MEKYVCLKYDKEFKDPHRKRKCILTRGIPKGCIWEVEIIKDTLSEDGKRGIKIEKEKMCRYLKIMEVD